MKIIPTYDDGQPCGWLDAKTSIIRAEFQDAARERGGVPAILLWALRDSPYDLATYLLNRMGEACPQEWSWPNEY